MINFFYTIQYIANTKFQESDRRISKTLGKFTQTSAILNRLIKKNLNKKGFEDTGLLFQWEDIVGSNIGKVTRPLKLYTAKGGGTTILKVQVNGPNAPQISLRLDYIREKINHFFGYNAVSKILIQQTGPYNFTNDEK